PLPPSTDLPIPDYPPSPPLSLLARPGKTGIRTRRIALLVASGIDGDIVRELYAALLKEGAQPRLVGQRLGKAESFNGHPLDVEITLETSPSVMYDALILPPGDAAMLALSRDGRAIEFVREQYRHLKPILALGSGATLLQAAGIPPRLPDGGEDWGLVVAEEADAAVAFAAFKAALVRHRVYERETDPPRV
ncbi:DJ-1/PfpI family protein, partial [Massilia sp.]|uniref:DJ-1/PfpI family protein n=1 Tax=Massilia sp. TaxID=1882437 RepID=UPI0028A0761B